MRQLALLAAFLIVVACGGGPVATRTATPSSAGPSPVAPGTAATGLPSAEQLCSLLGSADWSALGFQPDAAPDLNSEEPGSAHCTFAGTSGATGGLELDAYVDATVAEAEGTFDTIAEAAPEGRQITLPGADEVLIEPQIDEDFGAIIVRSGRFTFSVALPAGQQAEAQLLALAGIVLSRASAYR